MSQAQGRYERGLGVQSTGHHITRGAEKSQQCHKYLLQYGTFISRKTYRFEQGGAKHVSAPGAI